MALVVSVWSATPAPAAADTLLVAMNPYLSFSPLIIAKAEGFFDQQGIDVELVDLRRSALWLAPLIRGDLHVGAGPVTPGLFNAIARGAKIRIVAGKEFYDPDSTCTFQGIVLSRRLASQGDPGDPKLLRGRLLSIERDSIYGYWLDRLMRSAGLKPDDVETRALPAAAELEATISGQLDAFSCGEPWLQRSLASGEVELGHSAKDLLPGFQPGVMVFGPALLEREPDVGRRFFLAYFAGVRQYEEGKTERNLDLLSDYLDVDREILRQACWPSISSTGEANFAGFAGFQAWMKDRRMLDEELGPDRYWDGKFLRAVESNAGRPQP